MNDTSLLAALIKKVQAAKKGISLPTSLEDAAISDVMVEDVIYIHLACKHYFQV
jgi:hypothetical protein